MINPFNRFSVTTRGMYDGVKCTEGLIEIIRSYPPEQLHGYMQDLLIMLHEQKLHNKYHFFELDNHIELLKQLDAVIQESRII